MDPEINFQRQREIYLDSKYGKFILPAGNEERAKIDMAVYRKWGELLTAAKELYANTRDYSTLYVEHRRPAQGTDEAVDSLARKLELAGERKHSIMHEIKTLLVGLFRGNEFIAEEYFKDKYYPELEKAQYC